MKLKYQANKTIRMNYGFMGFTTDNWWFDYATNKWIKHEDLEIPTIKGFSSHQDCKSVRAFRRKLKKAPKGVKFILCSRWVGHDIIGYGSFKY